MLSGSRALEFLGSQGITALGNLVLSRRDSLLLDVRLTVPAEEVPRLRYADLPLSSGLFPFPLLDSALAKMCAASNNALVQRTLHPPKIPLKSLARPVKVGSSSASSADHGGASPVVPRSQKQVSTDLSSSSPQQGWKRRGRKGKAPFSWASSDSGHSGGKRGGAGEKFSWGAASIAGEGFPVSSLEALAGYWCRLLVAVRPAGRIPHPLQGLASSPRSHPDIVSDISGGRGGRQSVSSRLCASDCRLPLRSSRGCLGAFPRDSSSQVPGQLAGPHLFGGRGQTARPGSALALSLPWDCDKRGEVRYRPPADCKLPWYDHQYRGRQDFSVPVRVEKFLLVAETLCAMSAPPAQLWQVVLGCLASLERLVPHSRLRLRSLQWHLKAYWSPEIDTPSLPVPLSREMKVDLSWWMVWDHLLTGVRFGTPVPDLHLYSDASQSGWGAHLLFPVCVWGVVGEVDAHQSSRNEGDVSGIAVISGGGRRSSFDRDV